MDEQFAPAELLPPDRLRALSERRDGPGLWRVAAQLGALLLTGALAFGGGLWPALVLHGLLQATAFPAAHESLHGTAFRSRALNRWVCAVACWVILTPPALFRPFHFGHHRHTHEVGRDPELPMAGMEDWPRSRLAWAVLVTGLPYLGARLFGLTFFALGAPSGLCGRLFPYVRPEERGVIVWQARLILGLHAAIVAAGFLWAPMLRFWPLAWVFGHMIQGPWLSAEHTGLPGTGSVFERTRTVKLGAFARFWTWNMGLHAEHHGWPSVPFWQLPALHERVRGALPHRYASYWGVHVEGLGFRRRA